MIVCHCSVVRAEEIRTEVRLGAHTVELVGERCGAGVVCGSCEVAVAELILDEVARADAGDLARH